MRCEICNRKSESRFCEFHESAYKNLVKNFEAWKKSMNITWTEYLTQIKNNEFSGIWVKEVAQHLLASGFENKILDQETEVHKV
ncbi:hypothetical protein KEJ33_02075 [Candidatus Bathyarchaeota archaeon]|nr:hypothetical protein [Candidatus Bathyarchaeota archaeon]